VKKALASAKYSDASMGKFSERAAVDEERQTRGFNKRRKYESNLGNLTTEKEKQLKIFEQMGSTTATPTTTKKMK
jgi:hypothetical protein